MVGIALAASQAVLPAPALAFDHNIKVREVFAGTTGQANARFVELQMANNNQNLVGGNRVHVYNSAGTNIATFTFPSDLPGAANQSSILVATAQAQTMFGVMPDLTMAAVLPPAGGQVCYEDVDTDGAVPPQGFRDCVAWGSFTGASPSPTGNPFGPLTGIPTGKSILRDISAGNPGLLEAADDTNQSAADFDAVLPPELAPRNNAGATTSTAGTASIDGTGVLHFTPAAGVANNLAVAASGPNWRLTDTAAPIIPVAPCTSVTVNRVICPQAGVTAFAIDGGNMNDTLVTPDGLPAMVTGGDGNDRITTRNGTDSLLGEAGNDSLTGGAGADLLDGAGGKDKLDGGTGPDSLDGGTEKDTLTYESRTAGQGVQVDIDGEVGDDGGDLDDDGTGTKDTVMTTVEAVIGGGGEDVITGSETSNTLVGRQGPDQLHGLDGNDVIQAKGDGSQDTITCGAGLKDDIFADLTDNFPTAGPDACEIVH